LGSVPKVTVAITNEAGTDIYLVGSLDGSDWKGRYPYCYFEVIGPDGKSAVPELILEDPLCSPLREKDFVKVAPGEAFDPYDQSLGFFPAVQLDPAVFRAPGAYRVRFVYSTISDNIALWRNGGWDGIPENERPKILALFSQVPKLELWSDEITITVVAVAKQRPDAQRKLQSDRIRGMAVAKALEIVFGSRQEKIYIEKSPYVDGSLSKVAGCPVEVITREYYNSHLQGHSPTQRPILAETEIFVKDGEPDHQFHVRISYRGQIGVGGYWDGVFGIEEQTPILVDESHAVE
jgi:hypothetical protein